MKSRLALYRVVLASACVALIGVTAVRGAEPIAAPPADLDLIPAPAAPLLPSTSNSSRLAPVDTSGSPSAGTLQGPAFGLPIDATLSEGIVPTARRDGGSRALAPQMIGGDYFPAQGGSHAAPFTSVPGGSELTMPYSSMPYEGFSSMSFNPDEATVRISDRPVEQTMGDVPGVTPSHRICPHCRYCPHGLPYHECPHCEPSDQMMRRYRRRHGVTLPPDYGWSPPGHHPIDRVSIDYYRAFPSAWTGQAQAAPPVVRPTVYWPTDTTQLGYTYQHSPRWMPYPGMVPPTPHPGQWHIPLCGAYGPYGGYGRGHCPHCQPGGNSTPPAGGGSDDQQPTPAEGESMVRYPLGPQLRSSASAPDLTPVPF